MRRILLVWVVLIVLTILAFMAAPAASIAIGGGGVHVACGANGSSGCQ